MTPKSLLFVGSSMLLSCVIIFHIVSDLSNNINMIPVEEVNNKRKEVLGEEIDANDDYNHGEKKIALLQEGQYKDGEDVISEEYTEKRGQNSDEGSISSISAVHPIDEYIATTSTKVGSSLHNILKRLKEHSLPEAYGDDISADQDDIGIDTETQRCARYGYEYNPSTTTKRRRIFMGSLIADDSWHVIAAHAAEAYGLYHTVAFIESNTTQTMTKRETRFDKGSLNYRMLQSGIFGPNTSVYVDFRVDAAKDYPNMGHIMRENVQREHITKRWSAAGMQPDDIGIISDVDEVYTRDFLLALQSCDVPQFRPGQDCFRPQVTGQGLVFEGSAECQTGDRKKMGLFQRPNAVIGECIDRIGDIGVHPPTLRYYLKNEESHLLGTRIFNEQPNGIPYPLWKPWDFRNSPGENLVLEDGRLHTAYHFHNFFDSFDTYRNKYKTFGHPSEDADKKPLAQLNKPTADMVKCLRGVEGRCWSFEKIEGRRPILFEDESYRNARQNEMIKGLEEDEERFGTNAF